jgi:hypothetical protein
MLELGNLREHGVFLRREVLEHGYTDKQLLALLRDKLIARVRHGAYVSMDRWAASDELARYRMRCHAVLATHGPDVALSHTSAAAIHGLALWDADLTRVHLTRLTRATTRRCHDVAYHRGVVPDSDVIELPTGCLATTPPRSAVEHASLAGLESGLVTVDSYLDMAGQSGTECISGIYRQRQGWPGSARLQITIRLARSGAESVGETRLRFLCWEFHLPEPVLQFPVFDAGGTLIGKSDLAWPGRRVLGEFDGKVKYEKFLRPGESASDAVVREKKREDRMRESSGCSVMRFAWADLYARTSTAHRIERQLGLR